MAAPKLTPAEQDEVLKMLAAREPHATIAKKLEIGVTAVEYYAKKYRARIAKACEARDEGIIDKGLSSREKRVEELQWLYDLHKEELLNSGLHYTETKISATGKIVEYDVYNSGMITQMRGLIKDVAEERQGRILRVAPTTPDGKEPYDGGSALLKLESTIAGLAARMDTQASPGETDGSGS